MMTDHEHEEAIIRYDVKRRNDRSTWEKRDVLFLLAKIDAERAKSSELQVRLDAAIAEGCEHAADLSACRLANEILATTFIRETEQHALQQKVYESHKKVMEIVWGGHQKQFDEQAEIIETLIAERDEAIEALRPLVSQYELVTTDQGRLIVLLDYLTASGDMARAKLIVQRHDESKKGGE